MSRDYQLRVKLTLRQSQLGLKKLIISYQLYKATTIIKILFCYFHPLAIIYKIVDFNDLAIE